MVYVFRNAIGWASVSCIARAKLYYRLVKGSAGQEPYDDAQRAACECCDRLKVDKIYCNCNKRCYTSATACTNECRASLGCFTGICGPATTEQCAPE